MKRLLNLSMALLCTTFSFYSSLHAQCDFISGTKYSNGSSEACACEWVTGITTNCAYGNCSSSNETECITDCAGIWHQGAGDAGYLTCATLLPVEIKSFYGYSIGQKIELFWTTASEQHNDYFSIEHSTDGEHFQELVQIDGQGTTTEEHRYHFYHKTPGQGTHYYRLKQVDYDSQYSQTKAISITHSPEHKTYFLPVSPNPVADQFLLQYAEVNFTNKPININVLNSSGISVLQQVQVLNGANGSFEINVQSLRPGSYFLKLNNDEIHETQHIIIK